MKKMQEPKEISVQTTAEQTKQAHKAKVEDLFAEIVEVIKNNFVAIYQTQANALIMRIPNGQKFRVIVEEVS